MHYSFVREFFKSQRFGIEQDMCDMTVAEARSRVDAFKSRLSGLCRGLIEVFESQETMYDKYSKYRKGDDTGYFAFKDSLTFSHRSIYEFLEKEAPKEMNEFLKSLDARAVILQCLIAQVKHVPWNSWVQLLTDKRVTACFRWFQDSNLGSDHLELLGFLDDALLHRQHGSSTVKSFNWSKFRYFKKPWSWHSDGLELTSILAHSCYSGFQNYVIWSLENRPGLSLDNQTRAELMAVINESLLDGRASLSTVEVLQYLLNRGFDPNFHSQNTTFLAGLSIWQDYIIFFLNTRTDRPSPASWKAMKVFLEHGVDPHFHFSPSQPNSDDDGTVHLDVKMGIGPHVKERRQNFFTRKLWIDPLHTKGPNVSLRDIVQFLQPDNEDEIIRLIDRNLTLHEERSRLDLSPKSGLPIKAVAAIPYSSKDEQHKPKTTGEGSSFVSHLSGVGIFLRNQQTWTALLISFILGTSSAAIYSWWI
jgi:hypothetical protein